MQLHKLAARTVATVTKPGRHSDGGGLYLNVTVSGGRSWVFLWRTRGRRRELGLGSASTVSLAKARQRAAEARELVSDGGDPIAVKKRRHGITFEEAARELIAGLAPAWRSKRTREQWEMALRVYCAPISPMRVADISTEDVLRVLRPIWANKSQTASRIRGQIESVLDLAKVRGFRSGENPARWRGHLSAVLPRGSNVARPHHKAMPFEEVPAFLARLRAGGVAARAVEFLVLTAGRSGEVRGAPWSEIDLAKRLWIIPPERMKAGQEHRVPLSERACAVLRELAEVRINDFVFPGQRPKRPLSPEAMPRVLHRMGVDVTMHGFRSAFRDWAGERTTFPREVAEAALAHQVGNAVERAYRRGDALEKRRELMAAWCSFCNGEGAQSNVLSFVR